MKSIILHAFILIWLASYDIVLAENVTSYNTVNQQQQYSKSSKKHTWKKQKNGKLYLINNKKLPWSDANHECEIRSGKLLTIEDDQTQKIAVDVISGEKPGSYWTGLVEDLFKQWTWEGGYGSPKYLNWDIGQPSKANLEGCTVMNNRGKWHVSDCEVTKKSICQKEDDDIVDADPVGVHSTINDDNGDDDSESDVKASKKSITLKQNMTAKPENTTSMTSGSANIEEKSSQITLKSDTEEDSSKVQKSPTQSNYTVTQNSSSPINDSLAEKILIAPQINSTAPQQLNYFDISSMKGLDGTRLDHENQDNILKEVLEDFRSEPSQKNQSYYNTNVDSPTPAENTEEIATARTVKLTDETTNKQSDDQLLDSVLNSKQTINGKEDTKELDDMLDSVLELEGVSAEDKKQILESSASDAQATRKNTSTTESKINVGEPTSLEEPEKQNSKPPTENAFIGKQDNSTYNNSSVIDSRVNDELLLNSENKAEVPLINGSRNSSDTDHTQHTNDTDHTQHTNDSTVLTIKQNITRTNESSGNEFTKDDSYIVRQKTVLPNSITPSAETLIKSAKLKLKQKYQEESLRKKYANYKSNFKSKKIPSGNSDPKNISNLVKPQNTSALTSISIKTEKEETSSQKASTLDDTSKNESEDENDIDHMKTYGGNSDGVECAIPFVYEEETYFKCIDTRSDRPWCATTSSYDKMPKWGYCCLKGKCSSEDKKTEDLPTRKPSELYKLYISNEKQTTPHHTTVEPIDPSRVISVNDPLFNELKASTMHILHKEGEEHLSIHSGLNTYGGNRGKGDRCVIPFVYDGQTHMHCIPRDDGTSWCATTHNYDKLPTWGNCCDTEHCKEIY